MATLRGPGAIRILFLRSLLEPLERSWHASHIIKRRHYCSMKICSRFLHLSWSDIAGSMFRILYSRRYFWREFLKGTNRACPRISSRFSLWQNGERLGRALFSRGVRARSAREFSRGPFAADNELLGNDRYLNDGRFARWLFIGDEVNESGYAIYCHITSENWFHHVATVASAWFRSVDSGEFQWSLRFWCRTPWIPASS